MKLEFDSVEDLAHFLNWAYSSRGLPDLSQSAAEDVALDREARVPITPAADYCDPLPTIDTSGVAFDTPPEAAKEPAGKVLEQPAEPAKRKRRTKAEIEADEKGAIVPSGATPAELAKQVDAERAAKPAAQPEGTNPFEQAATPAAEAAGPAAEPAGDEGGEAAVVTPFQHIVRGREFIAKHGMPKYNETFTKAGLDANVMAYTGYQRALHMAAMDELEKAG